MDNGKDTSVYVDTVALQEWSNKMSSLNTRAVNILDSFKASVDSLTDSWLGNSASGFLNASDTLMTKAVSQHNSMKDVEQFLIKVIDTVEKM